MYYICTYSFWIVFLTVRQAFFFTLATQGGVASSREKWLHGTLVSHPVDWMNLQHGTLKFGGFPLGKFLEELILHQRSALGHAAADLEMTHGILVRDRWMGPWALWLWCHPNSHGINTVGFKARDGRLVCYGQAAINYWGMRFDAWTWEFAWICHYFATGAMVIENVHYKDRKHYAFYAILQTYRHTSESQHCFCHKRYVQIPWACKSHWPGGMNV